MSYSKNVFINCPFDNEYFPLLKPMLFTILYCKFKPQISEPKNSNDIRIINIKKLIRTSKHSIHDISRMEALNSNELPRFNMPFELGLDLGCNEYDKTDKECVILEREPDRYQKVLSDIGGQDVRVHNNEPRIIIKAIRDWLKDCYPRRKFESYTNLWQLFNEFTFNFELNMTEMGMDPHNFKEIPFSELIQNMHKWIRTKKKRMAL